MDVDVPAGQQHWTANQDVLGVENAGDTLTRHSSKVGDIWHFESASLTLGKDCLANRVFRVLLNTSGQRHQVVGALED